MIITYSDHKNAQRVANFDRSTDISYISNNNTMKLAIPTDEGLKISRDFKKAKGFLILTVKLGAIAEEEMKWNPAKEPEMSRETLASMIKGCSILIVRTMDPNYCEELKEKSIECILTKEDIITNIMVHYLENEFRKASDTCCCP